MRRSRRKSLRDDLSIELEKSPNKAQMRMIKRLYNRRGTTEGSKFVKPARHDLAFSDKFLAFSRRK